MVDESIAAMANSSVPRDQNLDSRSVSNETIADTTRASKLAEAQTVPKETKTENQPILEVDASLPPPPIKEPLFYESPAFAIAGACISLAITFILTVLGVRMKNLSWLFVAAWFCSILALIILSLRIPKAKWRKIVGVVSAIALACFFYWLNRVTQPKAESARVPVTIYWNNPASITYGTPLSDKQLNAKVFAHGEDLTKAGELIYNPTFGATLPLGTQTLYARFQPTNQNAYEEQSKTVAIVVNQAILLPQIKPTVDFSYEVMPFDPPYPPNTVIAGIRFKPGTLDVRLFLLVKRNSIKNLDFTIHLVNTSGQMLSIQAMAQRSTILGVAVYPVTVPGAGPDSVIVRHGDSQSTVSEGSATNLGSMEAVSDTWHVHCESLLEDIPLEFVMMVSRPYRTKMIEGFRVDGTYGSGTPGKISTITLFNDSGVPYHPTESEKKRIREYKRGVVEIRDPIIDLDGRFPLTVPVKQLEKPQQP